MTSPLPRGAVVVLVATFDEAGRLPADVIDGAHIVSVDSARTRTAGLRVAEVWATPAAERHARYATALYHLRVAASHRRRRPGLTRVV